MKPWSIKIMNLGSLYKCLDLFYLVLLSLLCSVAEASPVYDSGTVRRAIRAPLRYVSYLNSTFHKLKTKQKVTFMKAICRGDEMRVEYLWNGEYRTCSWAEYEGIGEAAMAAAVAAQWSCQELQMLAWSLRQKNISRDHAEERLSEFASQADRRRFRVSVPPGRDEAEISHFD